MKKKPIPVFDPEGAKAAGLSKNLQYMLDRDDAVCPYCDRRTNLVYGSTGMGDPRGEGFRKAGFSSHVFKCYETKLKSFGCQRGPYNSETELHDLIPLTP